MANSFFQFKQFRVDQEGAVMKVCTDSCLLGAYAANYLQQLVPIPNQILDIGTGSGVLALQMAQKFQGFIDALELDEGSFGQAVFNFGQSPWKDRVRAFQGDIRVWESDTRYDFILCNPPFYQKDLRSSSPEKNRARHASSLSYAELLVAIQTHLDPAGSFGVLLPYDQFGFFQELSLGVGFPAQEILQIRPTPGKEFFRTIAIFKRGPGELKEKQLAIREEAGNYSPAFRDILQDYYLAL